MSTVAVGSASLVTAVVIVAVACLVALSIARRRRKGPVCTSDAPTDKYGWSGLVRLETTRNVALAVWPSRSVARFVSHDEFTLLNACVEFDTIAGHARRVADTPEKRNVLVQLASEGWLQSHRDLVARVRVNSKPSAPGLSWLVIPTAGRPELLARAADSYCSQLSKWNHAFAVLIADDSKSAGEERQCEHAIRDLASVHSGPVMYTNRTLRRSLAACQATGEIDPLTQLKLTPSH